MKNVQETIKLSGFNNLTKILSFNFYDFCIAMNEQQKQDYINYIHTILANGTGADRQLRVWNETQDFVKVVDFIVDETKANVGEPGPLEFKTAS